LGAAQWERSTALYQIRWRTTHWQI
jgi:hypothetical protein